MTKVHFLEKKINTLTIIEHEDIVRLKAQIEITHKYIDFVKGINKND